MEKILFAKFNLKKRKIILNKSITRQYLIELA
jgi:hypothetical protein